MSSYLKVVFFTFVQNIKYYKYEYIRDFKVG